MRPEIRVGKLGGMGGIMQELEKILEEIIEQLKAEGCIIDDAAGNRAEEIVRKHMKEGSKKGMGYKNPVPSIDDVMLCKKFYISKTFKGGFIWDI